MTMYVHTQKAIKKGEPCDRLFIQVGKSKGQNKPIIAWKCTILPGIGVRHPGYKNPLSVEDTLNCGSALGHTNGAKPTAFFTPDSLYRKINEKQLFKLVGDVPAPTDTDDIMVESKLAKPVGVRFHKMLKGEDVPAPVQPKMDWSADDDVEEEQPSVEVDDPYRDLEVERLLTSNDEGKHPLLTPHTHTFVSDYRTSNSRLHDLYFKSAIEHLRGLDVCIMRLSKFSNLNMTDAICRLFEARKTLVWENAAYAEADILLRKLKLVVGHFIVEDNEGERVEF